MTLATYTAKAVLTLVLFSTFARHRQQRRAYSRRRLKLLNLWVLSVKLPVLHWTVLLMQEFDDQGVFDLLLYGFREFIFIIHTDTCRICSAPAEPDQPLFHPCKCSGTIRYIHQDW